MKPIQWQRRGLLYKPGTQNHFVESHAQLPTPFHLQDSQYRVFFACRDNRKRSHVGWFDLDLSRPEEILDEYSKPLLSAGNLGEFDGDGIFPASVVRDGNRVCMYFIGWNTGGRAPMFYASIGLAISDDGGLTFNKMGRTPVMARSDHDPCMVTSPTVLKENDVWRMWYVSGYRWEEIGDRLQSFYHIKYASSVDGVMWNREGRVCIDHVVPEEKNIARCWVIPDEGGYRAWYCYDRGTGYKIGYAESEDGLNWTRKDDKAGIEKPNEGFDSMAQCYPGVIRHEGKWYMFYNGNNFGREGIGWAVGETAED